MVKLFWHEQVVVNNLEKLFFHDIDVLKVHSSNESYIFVAVVQVVVEFRSEQDSWEDEPVNKNESILIFKYI